MFPVFFLICVTLMPFGEATVSKTTPMSKCDPTIHKNIEHFQKTNGRPQNLIQTAAKNNIEYVIATTVGYYPPDTSCVYSKFILNAKDKDKAEVKIWLLNKNSVTSEKSITVIEKSGSTYDPDSEILREHIFYREGSTLVYACSLAENAPEGPPSFFVKCAVGHCSAENVQKAIDALKAIGYQVPKRYPTCEKQCVA